MIPSLALAQGRTGAAVEAAPADRAGAVDATRDTVEPIQGRRDGQEEKYMKIVGTDGRLAVGDAIEAILREDPDAPAAAYVGRADADGDGHLDADELRAAGFDVGGDEAETMTIRVSIDVVCTNAGQ